ncbi:MAG: hypothetical protein ABSB19_01150 [Methylomonas sp.]|jgi:hypothetical protein
MNTEWSEINISESYAFINSNLSNLNNLLARCGRQFSSITQTGAAQALTMTLTQLQDGAYTALLNKFSNAYTLNVSGVAANATAQVLALPHVASVSVTDSGADIVANLAALESLGGRLSGIAQSDAGTPLSISAAQYASDGYALTKINGAYSLLINGFSAGAAININNSHVSSFTVTDSSGNIDNDLNNLQALTEQGELTAITRTDPKNPLTISISQLINDNSVLGLMPNATLNVTDSSANLINDLPILESHENNINSIMHTDAGKPDITLTTQQYDSYIDALAEIGAPYNLSINSSGGIAPQKIDPYIIRAPAGVTGAVTLTVNVSINGAGAVPIGAVTAQGDAPLEFIPHDLKPKAGDVWSISVTATDAAGVALNNGQIEIAPGFAGAAVDNSYTSAETVKFVGVNSVGLVTGGLPASYSATDSAYYILEGGASGNSAISTGQLAAAVKSSAVLQSYIENGRVIIDTLDGAAEPDGVNPASPGATVKIGAVNYTVPVINDNFDAQQGAILVNLPNISADQSVEIWVSGNGNIENVNAQSLSVAEPYAGFNAPEGLSIGGYQLYFTDQNGNSISNLQVAFSPVTGGAPESWLNAPSSTAPIDLDVVSVSQILNNQLPANSGTWYIVKDSAENLESAGNAAGLESFLSSHQVLGAYLTDGFAANGNAEPAALPIGADYLRVMEDSQDTTVQQQPYSVLTVKTVDGGGNPLAAGAYSLQFYNNGASFGNPITITATGGVSSPAIQLPADTALAAGLLTATLTLNGSMAIPAEIGWVPPGGGLANYSQSLNIWSGTVSRLPTTLSGIAANTLYVIQDSAENIVGVSASKLETSVLESLSGNGQLAFALSGGNDALSYLQRQLIENGPYGIMSAAPLTIDDTLLALQNLPGSEPGGTLTIYDTAAALTQLIDLAAVENTTAAYFGSAALDNALSDGRVWLTDNLADLMANSAALGQNFSALGNQHAAGVLVADSVADFQAQLANDATALQSLASNLDTANINYLVTDNVADIQTAVTQTTVQTFLKDNNVQVSILDSVANLEAAYTNGGFASLETALRNSGDTNADMQITVKDSIANLNGLFADPAYQGLVSNLTGVTVADSAANIANALANIDGNSVSPVSVADNIVIQDSLGNVQAALAQNPSLLQHVSTLELTAGGANGANTLSLQLPLSNGVSNGLINLPKVLLPFMSGPLSAVETADLSGNGTLVTITDANNNTVAFDLAGVRDSTLDTATGQGAFTHGGWYQIADANPNITGVGYDAGTGVLTVNGDNLSSVAGDYHADEIMLTGAGGGSYTLSSASFVTGTPTGGSVAIQLSAADQAAVDNLLNKAGADANDGAVYNLSAGNGWDSLTNSSDAIATQSITVSDIRPPSISSVSYDTAAGALTVKGANILSSGIQLNNLTLSGGGQSYQINPADDAISNATRSGFTVVLSPADQAMVNSLITSKMASYSLNAAGGWDSGGSISNLPVNINRDAYSALYIQTTDGSGNPLTDTATVQFSENGAPLAPVYSANGSKELPVQLPDNAVSGVLTASNASDGSALQIGLSPVGGGAPNFSASLNVWVGAAALLPATVSAINTNTLYVIRDSVQNLEILALSPNSVVSQLSADGELAFELNGGSLTYFQQQLIEQANLNFVNVGQATTISDTLHGLEHLTQPDPGETLVIHSDLAHLLYATQANAVQLTTPVVTALTNGNIWLNDALSILANTADQTAFQTAMQNVNAFSSIQGVEVGDSLADFEAESLSASALNGSLASAYDLSGANTGNIKYEIKDSFADLTPSSSSAAEVEKAVLQNFNPTVDVVDTVNNLQAAYNTGFSALKNVIDNAGDANGYILTAADTVANLSGLFNNSADYALLSLLKNITVVDSAHNIAVAFLNAASGAFINPVSLADSVTVKDSFDNVASALQTDTALLSQANVLQLTAGETAADIKNGAVLTVNPDSIGGANSVSALPEVLLPFMSGRLNATEAVSADHNGVTVTISDAGKHTVSIELVGVTDAHLNSYDQGGWYHI